MKLFLNIYLLILVSFVAGCSVATPRETFVAPTVEASVVEASPLIVPVIDKTAVVVAPDVEGAPDAFAHSPHRMPTGDSQVSKPEVVTEPVVAPAVSATVITSPSVASRQAESLTRAYVVKDGETLWTIAARPELYGDALLWSLLYQANRDQIKDPRQIYPEQVLSVPRNLSEEELQAAREWSRKSEVFPVKN